MAVTGNVDAKAETTKARAKGLEIGFKIGVKIARMAMLLTENPTSYALHMATEADRFKAVQGTARHSMLRCGDGLCKSSTAAAAGEVQQVREILVEVRAERRGAVIAHEVGGHTDHIVGLGGFTGVVISDPGPAARPMLIARIVVDEADDAGQPAADEPAEVDLDDLAVFDVLWIADLGRAAVVAPPAPLGAEMSEVRATGEFHQRVIPNPFGVVLGDPALIGRHAFGWDVPSRFAEMILMGIEEIREPLSGGVVLNAVRCGGQDAPGNELRRAVGGAGRLVVEELARPIERPCRDIAGDSA